MIKTYKYIDLLIKEEDVYTLYNKRLDDFYERSM